MDADDIVRQLAVALAAAGHTEAAAQLRAALPRWNPAPVLRLDWQLVAPRPRPRWPTAGTVELCAGLRELEAA